MTLSEAHRKILHETSGLPDSLIDSRGYHTITRAEFHQMISVDEDKRPFHTYLLKAEGWMGIPVIRPDGKKHCEILRVDGTVQSKNGFQRYVWPMNGVRNALDIHPQATQYVADPQIPLVVTEGIKKADSIFRFSNPLSPLCVLGQNGCWGWRSNPKGASTACPDWYDLALEDREVFIVVDSDYLTNDNVKAGWDACAFYLQSKVNHSNRVRMIIVPPNGRQKQGADDYLLSHSLDDLLSLATSPTQTIAMPTGQLEVLNALHLVDNADDEVPWLVRHLIAEESITVVAGHTQTYKTWHMLDLTLSAVVGQKSWMDHPQLEIEEPFPILYVNKEMRGKLGTRIKALIYHERYKEIPSLRESIAENLGIIEQADFDLKGENHVEAIIEASRDNAAKLIIFDSLSMVWSGDENSNSEVGSLFHKLRRIIEATGCSIVLLHHLVKPSKERSGFNPIHHMRGAGQLGQQADAVFLFTVDNTEDDGKIIRVINAKSRDDRELPSFLTKFSYGEGFDRQLLYVSDVVDALAKEAKEHPANTIVFADFMMQLLYEQTDMRTRPLKIGEIVAITQAFWNEMWGEKPGEKKIQRTLNQLRTRNLITMTGSQRQGYEYGLPTEDDIEKEETQEENQEETNDSKE